MVQQGSRPLRQYTRPLVLRGPEDRRAVERPARLSLEAGGEGVSRYDEAWLQRLIHAHPELLPVREIEPAFLPVVPVCLELPTPKGYIDNFFITPTGNLLFAECKLWRNPEARRQVVAQVMDYVEGMTSWGYVDLEQAAAQAQVPGDGRPRTRLYDLVAAPQEMDEAEFADAVSRNLRLGRGLFLIVGDGIREETESLTAHLQAHAGIHFALALVELALFELPNDCGLFVQPRIIGRTVNIERGIVRFDDARISVTPPPPDRPAGASKTLSEEEFYEQIAKSGHELPGRVQAFLDRLEPLGVTPEIKKSLILRWHAPDGTTRNVGYILTSGRTWTDAVNWGASELGILDITHDYVKEVAQAIGGDVKAISGKEETLHVVLGGRAPQIEKLLEHEDAWAIAIERLGRCIIERLQAGNG